MSAPPGLPPLALYVHLPWCVRKCPYCDFNSYTLHGELPEASYVEALLADFATQRDALQGRVIGSVFFGGGTPSLFAPSALQRLLEAVRAESDLAPEVEITLEANPGTIEHGAFAEYRAAGINRVSIGAQSFSDRSLGLLGRIHAARDTSRAVEELHRAGIEEVNLDLMYALPQQDRAGALHDIECAIALEPTHISHYELTLEPGTVFGGRPPAGLPDPDQALEIQLACQERLDAAGFAHYEVSAYARPGRRCRHNLNYWEFGDYLGLGAGAHGKLSRRRDGQLIIERTWREREPRRYVSAAGTPPARRAVPQAELPFEYLMNRLRLRAGFSGADFEERTGLSSAVLLEPMRDLSARGLIERLETDSDPGARTRWRASPLGYRFLNDVLAEFLPARA